MHKNSEFLNCDLDLWIGCLDPHNLFIKIMDTPWVTTNSASNQHLLDIYQTHQLLLIRNCIHPPPPPNHTLRRIRNAYHDASKKGKKSTKLTFRCETFNSNKKEQMEIDKVLSWCDKEENDLKSSPAWYCSFVAQDDENLVRSVLQFQQDSVSKKRKRNDEKQQQQETNDACCFPPMLNGHQQGSAAWVFIGRRSLDTSMEGRPEHVDRITHDGTYHVQCEGKRELKEVQPVLFRLCSCFPFCFPSG